MSTLEIVFRGQDGVGSIVNNISAEFNTLNEATGKAKESGTGFFSGMLSSAGGFIAANIVGAISSQVSDFVGSIGKVTADEQDQMAQLQAGLTSTGGKAGVTIDMLQQLAHAQADQTKFSVAQTEAIEKVGLTFTSINKSVFPQTVQLAEDMSQRLGIQGSAAMTMLGKAADDPIKGMAALHKTGTSFTEQQIEQIKALTASGDKLGAYQIILHEVAAEYGGSATAAAQTFSGQQEILAHKMDEVKVKIGTAVLPILGQLTGFIASNVVPILSTFADWFAAKLPVAINFVTTAIKSVMGIWNQAGDAAASFSEQIGIVFDDLITGGADVVGPFQAAGRVIAGVFDLIRTTIKGAMSDSEGPIHGFLALFDQLSPSFELLHAVVATAIPSIKLIITDAFGIIQGFLKEHGAKITADLTGAWQQIQSVISAVIPPIQTIVNQVLGAVATFIHAHGADIQATLGQTWDKIANIIHLALDLIQAIVPPVLKAIAGFIKAHGTEIQAILSAVWSAVKAIIDAALTLIQGVITVALDLIHGNWSKAWEDIKAMSARIVQDIISVLRADLEILKTVFSGAIQWVNDEWHKLPGQLADVGKAIVDAIASGLDSAWESFKASMLKKLADLRAQLPFSEPKDTSSPLYGLSKSGQAIVGNMQAGIDSARLQIGGALVNGRSHGGGSSAPAATTIAGGGPSFTFVIDARGAYMTPKQYEDISRKVIAESGNKALNRQRAGG